MIERDAPIGVMDSGIGGLTVVRELQHILPGEDIIYYGDNANCPYGNKSYDQIVVLSRKMLDFFCENKVKVVAVACNTISTLLDYLKPNLGFEIIGIIDSAAACVSDKGLKEVGLLATEFTVSTGYYERAIHSHSPIIKVIAQGSPLLAALLEKNYGGTKQSEIDAEIKKQVDHILSRCCVSHLILGCTHYPIAEESFKRYYPNLKLINPAIEQAKAVRAFLEKNDSVNTQRQGCFTVCTSGDPQVYLDMARRLGLFKTTALHLT